MADDFKMVVLLRVVSKVTGVPVEELTKDTLIPPEHNTEIRERMVVETGCTIMVDDITSMTIGSLASKCNTRF